MTHKQIVVLGTPGGSWTAGASHLVGGTGVALHVGTEADLRRLGEFAGARWLVLVENPVHGLARSLVRAPDADIEAWMNRWVHVGRELMNLLQTRPGQSLFVDWSEALAAPERFAACLRERLGADVTMGAAAIDEPADLAAVALARLALARHRQASALAAELEAACMPLGGTATDDESPGSASSADGLQDVALAWSTIATLQRRLLDTARSETQALGRARDLGSQLESATAGLQNTEQALNEAIAARIAAKDAADSLELKLAFDAQERAAKVLALDAARQRLDELQAERDACRVELERHARDMVALQARVLRAEREDAHLLMQLHETQEVIEQEIVARQQADQRLLEASGQLTMHQAGAALTAAKVVLGAERDDEPYRELDVAFAGVRLHDMPLGDVGMRLIEHRQHPGLVVFEGEAGQRLLSSWHESGSEGERRYMLLVPADDAGSALLDRLPSADRRRLDDAIDLLERSLIGAPAHATWLALVRRLKVEIKERQPRFRFNAMDVQPVEGRPSTLEVSFIGAEFGARSWSVLRARWQPGARHPVELVHGADRAEMFPLRGWRRLTGDPAQPLDAWVMPLASAPGRSEGFDTWQTLDQGDADFLTALLDALPAAAHRAVESELIPSEDAARLLGEAHLLLRLVPVPPVPPSRGLRGVARKAWRAMRRRRADVAQGQGAAA